MAINKVFKDFYLKLLLKFKDLYLNFKVLEKFNLIDKVFIDSYLIYKMFEDLILFPIILNFQMVLTILVIFFNNLKVFTHEKIIENYFYSQISFRYYLKLILNLHF